MTSDFRKSIRKILSNKYLVGAALFSGLCVALFVPSGEAEAAINPEFTQTGAGQEKIEKAKKSLESLTISEPEATIKAEASANSSELGPPPGMQTNFPPETNNSNARKEIPDQLIERWVEVDISLQRIYLWEGRRLVDSYLVSTGMPATPTPYGTYRAWHWSISEHMSGADFDLPGVPYTIYFHGGYSLHGTYWHNNFGNRMSHGCVNLPTPKARELWYWAIDNFRDLRVWTHE